MQSSLLQEDLVDETDQINTKFDLTQLLSLTPELCQDKIKLSKEQQFFTVNLKIEAEKICQNLFKKPNLDIFCVIDVSGSMGGEKIELVQKTLKYLLEVLKPEDRITLISFDNQAKQLVRSKKVNDKNKPAIQNQIDNIYRGGGTRVKKGIDECLEEIRQRKTKNQATGILLLSDGSDQELKAHDVNSYIKLKEAYHQQTNTETIHTFGYGTGCDVETLKAQAERCRGNFYFISDVNKINEYFVSCVGNIASTVVQEANIDIEQNQFDLPGMQFHKTYGKNWTSVSATKKTINLNSLKNNTSQNLVFEISIPAITNQDFLTNESKVISAQKSVIKIKTSEGIEKEVKTSELITEIHRNESKVHIKENRYVKKQLAKVQSFELQEEAGKFCDKGMFKEAEKLNRLAIQKIQEFKYEDRQLKVFEVQVLEKQKIISDQVHSKIKLDKSQISDIDNKIDFIKKEEYIPGLDPINATDTQKEMLRKLHTSQSDFDSNVSQKSLVIEYSDQMINSLAEKFFIKYDKNKDGKIGKNEIGALSAGVWKKNPEIKNYIESHKENVSSGLQNVLNGGFGVHVDITKSVVVRKFRELYR